MNKFKLIILIFSACFVFDSICAQDWANLGMYKEANSHMSPLRKQIIFTKRIILDEIIIFGDLLMPEHQLIEKSEKIAKRIFFDFLCFRSGLTY